MFLFRWATATAVVTYGLLIAGGFVHSTGSALACPDWPTCYGTLMPPMTGGIFYEHGHRLLGAAVGLMTCVLCVLVFVQRRDDRRLKTLAVAAVLMVVVQGLLGGLTVMLRLPPVVSTSHFALSMIFFVTTIVLAFGLRPAAATAPEPPSRSARRWIVGAALIVYVQMALGAAMRHAGVSLVCVDLPLCRGQLWPPGAPAIVYLHVLHRYVGVVAALAVIAMAIVLVRAKAPARIRRLGLGASVLVCVQIVLGIFAILRFLDLSIVMAHMGVAAALLATLASMALYAAPARSEALVVSPAASRQPAALGA